MTAPRSGDVTVTSDEYVDPMARPSPIHRMVNAAVPFVMQRTDIDAVLEGVDMAAVVERIDVNDIAERLDLNAIVERLDVDRIAERLDLDRLLERIDVDRIAARIDVDRLVERLDVDTIADRLDMDRITQRLDVNSIAERIHLDEMLTRVQLAPLIGRGTQEVAGSGLGFFRRQLGRVGPKGYFARLVAAAMDAGFVFILFGWIGSMLAWGIEALGPEGERFNAPRWLTLTAFALWVAVYFGVSFLVLHTSLGWFLAVGRRRSDAPPD